MRNIIWAGVLFLASCVSPKGTPVEEPEIMTNTTGKGQVVLLEFTRGEAYNHPSMVVWAEDLEGNYLETLMVTRYVSAGVYAHGQLAPGKWDNKEGAARRPATMPYWAHKRNEKAPDGLYIPSPRNPVPDALTAATPVGSFRLRSHLSEKRETRFRVLLEINQAWDANKFWTNGKFPGDLDYFGSLQPSLVYAATIDPSIAGEVVHLNPIGHGHPSGKDGRLYTDLTTLTTAREIIHAVTITLQP